MFFKIAAGIVAAVILFAIVYVLYVVLQYRRIEDEKTLEIKNPCLLYTSDAADEL